MKKQTKRKINFNIDFEIITDLCMVICTIMTMPLAMSLMDYEVGWNKLIYAPILLFGIIGTIGFIKYKLYDAIRGGLV